MNRSILTTAFTLTISSKNQIVLPPEVLSEQGWQAGDKVILLQVDGRVELVKLAPLMSLFGSANGSSNGFVHDED